MSDTPSYPRVTGRTSRLVRDGLIIALQQQELVLFVAPTMACAEELRVATEYVATHLVIEPYRATILKRIEYASLFNWRSKVRACVGNVRVLADHSCWDDYWTTRIKDRPPRWTV